MKEQEINSVSVAKDYVFANWGERVTVVDSVERIREGVITEFDPSNSRDTKVVYKDGGFDWYNRNEVEESMQAREQVKIDINN
jgi:pyruvate/2-oxoglutarate dehydrogenase complex dihydrolipoamide dehydrogenase (E3) component